MTRTGLASVLLAGGWLVSALAACSPEVREAETLTVTLAARHLPAGHSADTLFPGTSLGVVCFDQTPPLTVTAVTAREIIEPFDASLRGRSPSPESPPLVLRLPGGLDTPGQRLCDVVLFDDADGNAQFDTGERYVSAWSGGRGSYRLVYTSDATDVPGAKEGWNLLEGGFPVAYHPDFRQIRVRINPVLAPVPSRR